MTCQIDRYRPVHLGLVAAVRFVAVLCMLSCTGCSKYYTDYNAFLREPASTVSATEYRLAPPDAIQIYSKRVTELNGFGGVVRPDGKLALPLVGTVYVNGLTSDETAVLIKKLAQEYYEDSDITVQIIGFNSKKVYVFGEVSVAGPFPYDGANTVLETLAAAQPTRLANPTQIQIMRPGKDGTSTHRMTINLDEMVRLGDITLNAVLEEGDIIYVPANGMAAVGLALQQLLLPIQPAAATVRGPASIEETVVGTTYGRDR